jgi:hypothetical protein
MRATLRRADRFFRAGVLFFCLAMPTFAAAETAPSRGGEPSWRDLLPPEPIDPTIERAFALREAGDGAGAIALLEPQAEGGNLSAQLALGFMFARGDGVARDAARAASWWRRAADQGQTYAQYAFGEAALAGAGVPADAALAHAYFTLAVERTRAAGPFLDLVKFVQGEAAAKLSPAQRAESAAIVRAWYAARPALAPTMPAAP